MNSNEYKFNCFDEVFIKSLNRNGTVRTVYCDSNCGVRVYSYEVYYMEDSFQPHIKYGVNDYLGKKPVYIRVYEKDLIKVSNIENKDISKDISDAVRYCYGYGPESLYNTNVSTAFGLDLDKIGEMHNLRRIVEDDQAYRERILKNIRGTSSVTSSTEDLSVSIKHVACSHSWKTYEGLLNKYDFCTICDEKKV